MAFDAFLKIDGIDGESIDSKFPKNIQIESFSWGVSNSGSSSYGGGGGSGKANFQDFSFSMPTNSASPKLAGACSTGLHIPKAVLNVRKTGGGKDPGQPYLIFTFTDILISSYSIGGSAGSDLTQESITFNYTKVEESYAVQKKDGTLEAALKTSFDLKLNEAE